MKFDDLVFKSVGCCEIHTQAEVNTQDTDTFVTKVTDDLFSVSIHNKDGSLISRHTLLNRQEVEGLL